MFESITIGEIAVSVTFLVGFVSGIAYLRKHVRTWIEKALEDRFRNIDDQFKKIEENQQDLRKKIDTVDMNACKNYLVHFLSDVEKNDVGEVAKERFYEQYKHYIDKGGNSYILNKVDSLRKSGRL